MGTRKSHPPTETETETHEAMIDYPDAFDLTDRRSYQLRPVYAIDTHSGVAITETLNVIADDEDEAKHYALDYSGRSPSDIVGWLDVVEHDAPVPKRRESGVIKISEDEYYEMRHEENRESPASSWQCSCWVCGPFNLDDTDSDVQGCPNCGLTTAMSRLVKKDITELRDGTQLIRKNLTVVGDGSDDSGDEITKTDEMLTDLMGA